MYQRLEALREGVEDWFKCYSFSNEGRFLPGIGDVRRRVEKLQIDLRIAIVTSRVNNAGVHTTTAAALVHRIIELEASTKAKNE
jgi:hypothetical protein